MYTFLKAWIKKKFTTSLNNSNGKKAITNEDNGFDAHGRKIRPCHQKNDQLDMKINRDIPSDELRKEVICMFESLRNEMASLKNETASFRNEMDLKLLNMYKSLKNDLSKK